MTEPDVEAIAVALEDEYVAIFGKRCSTADARRLALRAVQTLQDNVKPRLRIILAPWISGDVTFSQWCNEVDRWFLSGAIQEAEKVSWLDDASRALRALRAHVLGEGS